MINSASNARLKAIRRLKRSKAADPCEILIEGPHLLGAALDAGLELRDVLVTPHFLESSGALLARLEQPPETVETRLLEQIADADSPRGVVARATAPASRIDDLDPAGPGVVVYADHLQDPGNLGALARVGEAAGCHSLVLGPGCAHVFHPRALRASAGSLLRFPIASGVDGAALAQWAGSRPWVALVPRGGESLFRSQIPADAVLLIGSEGGGLTADLLQRAEHRLTVPLAGEVESLNVTVAAAVVLFELRRRTQEP